MRTRMAVRYLSNLALALGAGFLVVATMAFAAPAAAALTFAIAIGATVIGVFMLGYDRSIVQRVLGALVTVLGAWTIVASLVFFPTTVVWLGFASALGFAALAVIGLTVHEFRSERVVHSIQVEHAYPREREPASA